MEHNTGRSNTVVNDAQRVYINSRLADYTLRIANATSRQTRKKIQREKEEFMRKHGITVITDGIQ